VNDWRTEIRERIASDSRAAQALLAAVDGLIRKGSARVTTKLQLETMREQLEDLLICLRSVGFEHPHDRRLLTVFEGWLDQLRQVIVSILMDQRRRRVA
jgi:hypothetical protein